MLEFMAEHWRCLPPGYRKLGGAARAQPGDLRWLSDVRQWHEVLPAEIGKNPDHETYIFATPDKIRGAPPLYRPVKPGAIRKTGMLVWAAGDALTGEWKAITMAGQAAPERLRFIEPAPPPGWEWLETHQILREGDRCQQRIEGRTETRWVPGDLFGNHPTTDYFYLRSTRHTYGNKETPQDRAYEGWGSF